MVMAFVVAEASSAQEHYFELSATDRIGLGLTVFNNNFAVVYDRRSVALPAGDLELEFTDVAMTIDPTTVDLTSNKRNGFVAQQQSYRFDLLNRGSLLERFVGRKVKYSRSLLVDGNFEKVLREGILLSINPEIVKFGDVIEVDPVGTISLPYIPDDLKTSPTLVFVGKNKKRGIQTVQVRYHTRDIGWESDYALSLDDKGRLDGWITVHNHSGSDFETSGLKLIAGEVNKDNAAPVAEMMAMRSVAADSSQMKSVAVGDYHAYNYPDVVRLLNNDVTQLRFLSADGVDVAREYRLTGSAQRYGSEPIQNVSPTV